jgi:TIR domain-containing protein
MFWTISSFPKCGYHVFLSHSSEDKPWLVDPLSERLQSIQRIPWLDRRDFPLGANRYHALQNNILKSRHVVYLITEATLDRARGWQVLEMAYGGILQDNLCCGIDLSCVELPLFFVDRTHPVLSLSVWQRLLLNAGPNQFHRPPDDPVEWSADVIETFIRQQENFAAVLSYSIAHDPTIQAYVDARHGLADRVAARYP